MQNLKAVIMGMATARALFWSNMPNPAIAPASFGIIKPGPRAVVVLAEAAHFYSAWFAMGNDLSPKSPPSSPGAPLRDKIPAFHRKC
jgi:hypothetical protein